MGIRIIGSSDSRDCGQSYQEVEKIVRVNSTPDPTKFNIIRQRVVNGYPILWVHYPDVENYEGNKILMYDKHFDLELIKNSIDPHFFTNGDSPVARFVPTDRGMYMAVKLAKALL